jgi:hypothetical protein
MNIYLIFFIILTGIILIFLFANLTSNSNLLNDNERIIIIKNIYKGNSMELIIDSNYLSIVFDNLINLIQDFVKKLISQENKKLTKEEINNLLPKYISSVVENILKITLIKLFEQYEITDLNVLKTKLLSIIQNNYINYFLIENDIKNTTDILNNSSQYLNALEIYSKNDAIIKIPKLLSNIVLDMSKIILQNILVFDNDGNIIKTNDLINIKNQFKNILNKFMPYKKVYFETNNNGTNNLHGLTLKLDQLN